MLREISFYSVYFILFAAIIFYKKYKQYVFYKYFLFYLLFAVIFETLGRVFIESNNSWIYNIYTFFEFNLMVLIYYYLTKEKVSHKMIFFLAISFNIFYGLSFVFKELEKYSVPLLGLLVSVFLVLYLRELLDSKKILNYKSMLSFWITLGFLIYYLSSIPFFSVYAIGGITSRELFPLLLSIIIMKNCCFIFGLLWSKKMKV